MVIEIPLSPVSSPPSDVKVDYSRDDIDFDDEPPPPDTSKFSHLAVEEMEVTSPTEMVLSFAEIPSTEGNFWLRSTFFAHHVDIFLMLCF